MPQHSSISSLFSRAYEYVATKFHRLKSWVTDFFDSGKKAWEEHVPMTKARAVRMLTRGLPRGTKVSIDVDSDGAGSLDMKADYIEEVSKGFDLESGVAQSGYMALEKTGGGLGRKIMRNQIEFFKATGIKKLEMFAGLDAGGYTWARLGFLPYSKGEHRSDFLDLKKEVKQRYKKLEPLLDSREKGRMEKILEFKDGKDVWKLADARIDLKKRLREVFRKAANDNRQAQKVQEKVSSLVNSDDLQDEKKPLTIGRILLAGTTWYGEMDFNNKAQMKRVENYVGGFAPPPRKKQPAKAARSA